jgi:cell division initiation protein
MRLTPLDIRKQEFKKGMRGLDSDEVYAFLSTIADEYEAVLNDNKALRERLLELDDKVQEYRNMEKTLRDTLLTAERITVEAKDNARREAELIIKQAELDADRGVRDIKANASRLRQEIQSLKRQRESYMARMKMLVESHLKFLETAEKDFEEEEKALNVEEKARSRQPEPKRVITTRQRDDEPSSKRAAAATLPADRDIGETSMSPPLDTPVVPSPMDRPLPDGPPAKPTEGTRADAETETASGGTVTMTKPAPPQKLSELLDRVVERNRQTQPQSKQSHSTEAELAPEPAQEPDVDLSATPLVAKAPEPDAEDEDSNTGKSEWSLERLKRDILFRRSKKDETG